MRKVYLLSEMVGMQIGAFSEVGRFIKKVVAEVKAVRISRGGIVILDCGTTEQRDKALKIS